VEDKMMTTLNNAIDYALEMTNYNLNGSAYKIELEDVWHVYFSTPTEDEEGRPMTPPTSEMQIMDVEILFRDGGLVASVLKRENMKDYEVAALMDYLLEEIDIPDYSDMPPLED
jgi:hypothetical protein